MIADRVREYGPEEFREWLAEASTPESVAEQVSDEMAFWLQAGGQVQRG